MRSCRHWAGLAYLLYSTKFPLYKPNNESSNIILGLTIQSIIQHTHMSLSSDSVALRRKRTATERALNNADPLVVKKKACQAGVTISNNGPSVSHFFMLLDILR